MSLTKHGVLGLAIALAAAACGSDDDDGGGSGGTGGSGAAAGSGGAGASAGSGGTGGSAGTGGSGAGGSGGTGAAGSGGTGAAGAGGAGGSAPDAQATVSVTYFAVEYEQGQAGGETGLAGVEVCVVDEAGQVVDAANLCATTGADGRFTIEGLEPETRVLFRYTKDGYTGGLSAVLTGAQDIVAEAGGFRMLSNLADGGLPTIPGWDPAVTRDLTKGSFNVAPLRALPPDAGAGPIGNGLTWVEGVSFSITPAGGDGPMYVDANEDFVPNATATVAGGWGAWFINLEPGTYELSASHATLTCNPVGQLWGWTNTDGTTQDVPVLASLNTQTVVVFCQ